MVKVTFICLYMTPDTLKAHCHILENINCVALFSKKLYCLFHLFENVFYVCLRTISVVPMGGAWKDNSDHKKIQNIKTELQGLQIKWRYLNTLGTVNNSIICLRKQDTFRRKNVVIWENSRYVRFFLMLQSNLFKLFCSYLHGFLIFGVQIVYVVL